MNIAQMMSQLQRIDGNRQDKSMAGVAGNSFSKGTNKRDNFSRILGNTLEKADPCKSGSCKPADDSKELKKPVNTSDAPDVKTDEINSDEINSDEINSDETEFPEKTGNPEETGQLEESGSPEISGTDETDKMLFLQLADLLKFLGITIDEKDSKAQNAGSVKEAGKLQEQAGIFLQEPGVRETILRLAEILEELSVNGNSGKASPVLQELKSLAEAQNTGLNSVRGRDFLAKLVRVLEKALGKSSADKSNSLVSKFESKNLSSFIEFVSNSLSVEEDKAAAPNAKGSELLVGDTARKNYNGFDLNQSGINNPHGERPVISGQGFSALKEVLGNEQPTQLSKMAQNIFGQIAQKAKVVVLPGITEMQIQLKPGFLGKLSMSIISENGSVTARFTAETQSVKGIIEANLNSLKDTLNQQGIKVEQLIVDIGTQNHQSSFEHRQNMYHAHKHGKNNRISANAEEVEGMFSAGSKNGVQKNYYGGTVEFTA